jgi:hypothetical protein
MTMTKRSASHIIFPQTVFESAQTKEDLEDWLLAQNTGFIKKMRKARQDDLSGKGVTWEQIRKDLCIK